MVKCKSKGWMKLVSMLGDDSPFGVTLTFGNSIVGVGVLFLPFIFKQCGVIISVLYLVFGVGIMILFSLWVHKALNYAREKGHRCSSIEDAVDVCFGKGWYWIVKIISLVFLFGVLIVFTMVMISMIEDMVNSVFEGNGLFIDSEGYETWYGRLIIGGSIMVLAFLLSLVEKIRKLRFISAIGLVCDLIFFVIMVVMFLLGETDEMRSGRPVWIPDFSEPSTIPNMISLAGVVTFSFLLITVPQVHAEFKTETLHLVEMSIYNSLLLVFLLYVCLAMVGYFSFFDNTQDNIIKSYKGASIVVNVIRLIIFIEVFLSYPIFSYSVANSLYSILEKFTDASRLCCLGIKRKENLGRIIAASVTGENYIKEIELDEFGEEITQDSEKSSLHHVDNMPKSQRVQRIAKIAFLAACISIFVGSVATFFQNAQSVLGYFANSAGVILGIVVPGAVYLKFGYKRKGGKGMSTIGLVLRIIFVALATICFGIIPLIVNFLQDIGLVPRIPGQTPVETTMSTGLFGFFY